MSEMTSFGVDVKPQLSNSITVPSLVASSLLTTSCTLRPLPCHVCLCNVQRKCVLWQTEDESGSSIDIDEDSDDADINDGGDLHARQQQLRSRPSRGRPQPDMADDDDDDEF